MCPSFIQLKPNETFGEGEALMRSPRMMCVLFLMSLLTACAETNTSTVQDGTFDFSNYRPTAGAQEYLTMASISKVLNERHEWVRLDCRPYFDEYDGLYIVVTGPPLHSQNNWLRVGCKELYDENGNYLPSTLTVVGKSVLDERYDVLYPDTETSKSCGPRRIHVTVHDGMHMLFSTNLPGPEKSFMRIPIPSSLSQGKVRVVLSCGDFARNVRPEY